MLTPLAGMTELPITVCKIGDERALTNWVLELESKLMHGRLCIRRESLHSSRMWNLALFTSSKPRFREGRRDGHPVSCTALQWIGVVAQRCKACPVEWVRVESSRGRQP